MHQQQLEENVAEQRKTNSQLKQLNEELEKKNSARETAKLKILQAEKAWQDAQTTLSAKTAECNRLQEEFPHLKLPVRLEYSEFKAFQINGLWHDDELSELRSKLFASALKLHEAWLAEVSKKGKGFGGNISAVTLMLSGKHPEDKQHSLLIWQSLFMMVPVVSTTFASFASLFRDLEASSLGWLFIDEAGQAVPQAAVGALWRAQRAVVVGDPQQIEPVFTLPTKLITALSRLSPHTSNGDYAPNRVSVQNLADQANRYGAYLFDEGDSPLWVGSPLRVHRRCTDPMFSWSNCIAYKGKMVLAGPREKPDAPPIYCASTWIDIKGKTSKRQEVPEQTQFIVNLLTRLYELDGKLPELYIITPFKAIKTELIHSIESKWPRQQKRPNLKNWCQKRIGTMHTFQGKEEDTVIMVLGADQEHVKAVNWAASKPNILNVALTRAKRRFYLVGDRQLWGSTGSFKWPVEKFGTTTPQNFLMQMRPKSVGASK